MYWHRDKYTNKLHWELKERPSWDRHGGKIYLIPSMDPNARSVRWKPNIHSLCETLLGTPLNGVQAFQKWIEEKKKRKEGEETSHWLPRQERFAKYREGIEVVRVFGETSDLLILAMYRQYVSCAKDIYLDILFYETAHSLLGDKHPLWGELAPRMIPNSNIQEICLVYANGK